MPRKHLSHLAQFLLITLLLAACAPVQPSAPTPVPPTAPLPTAAPVKPTAGPVPPTAPAPTAVPVTPAPQPVVRRIEFAPGASRASVQGRVPVGGVDAWVLRANAGQQLSLRLTPKSGKAILVVYGADGTVLQSDHVEGAAFEGVLPITQDYNIHVVNRGDVGAEYTLEVGISPVPQAHAGGAARAPTPAQPVVLREEPPPLGFRIDT